MALNVTQLISSLSLTEAQTGDSAYPFIFILRNPEDGEIDVPSDGLVSFIVVALNDDPSTTTPGFINVLIEISFDGGITWQSAYNNGVFSTPFDGASSAVVQHSITDPYVYNDVTIDYTGQFDDSSTVMVRAAASLTGWGHGPWGHFPWGHPSGTDLMTESWSFQVVDLTAPRLLSAEAINRKTIRLTYDDDMRSGTPDGRGRVRSGINGTWDMSTGGETLNIIVDSGNTQEITFQTYMWLIPAAVTSAEMATALSSLVVGGVAEADGALGFYVYSSTVGDSSTIQITGGTANTIFGFSTSLATGSSEGVLDAENYTIDRNNIYPDVAVHLVVESVAFVDISLCMVDLTVQWEMTPRAPYGVTVDTDVADTSNNDIDPDYDSVLFDGFQPEWPVDRDTEIKMPQAVWDGDPLRVTRAIINIAQEGEDLKVADIDELWDVWNVDTANTQTIELMLFDAGNPFSDLGLTDEQNRKLVDLLPYIYQQKGLPDGVTATILSLLEIPVTIVPHTENSWRLGVDRLGSDYPASIWSSNSETFGLTGGGTLTVIIDDGSEQTIEFINSDFVLPSAATAEEVAIVINSQLVGGAANIFDDGGGIRVEILSTKWGDGASVYVTGGTFATIIGFDTAIQTGSGGCMLGPSGERAKRTFDLEYSTVVPSDEEIVKIKRIARYMKPVNNHLGKIRPAKNIPVPEYWVLGFDYLGTDTVLGG